MGNGFVITAVTVTNQSGYYIFEVRAAGGDAVYARFVDLYSAATFLTMLHNTTKLASVRLSVHIPNAASDRNLAELAGYVKDYLNG